MVLIKKFRIYHDEEDEYSTDFLAIYYHQKKITLILSKFILINYYAMDQNINLVE